MKLVVPMSGEGRRFIQAGYSDPKPLLIIDGKTMIEHVVNLFPGADSVLFIANDRHLSTTNMRETLLKIRPDCQILEVKAGTKAGPVDVVSEAFDLIDDEDEVIVSYCDYGTVWNYENFLKDARESNADGSIACYRGFHPHMLGTDNYAFVREKDGVLLEIKEKEPFTNDRMSEFASNGTYYFKSGAILKKYFKKMLSSGSTINGEYYVSLVYNFLVEDSLSVNIFEIEKMLQWGTPYDLEVYKSWSNYFSNKEKFISKVRNLPRTVTVMPAAGRGSRFSEIGYEVPKPMIRVDGKPMIVSATNCLPASDSYVFVCLKDHVDNFKIDDFLKKEYEECKVVSLSETTSGQACTCEIAIENAGINLDQPILISACDNGVVYDSEKYQSLIKDETNDVIVWSFRNNQASKRNPNAYAWLDVDENDLIKHVSCKNFIYDDPLKTHAIIGTMFFRKARYFIDGLRRNYESLTTTNGEYYVDDVINQNISAGLKVKVFESENYICWGTPDDYRTYQYWKEHFTGEKD